MCSPVTRFAPLLPAGIPRIVGIVNITTDSFSDGGRYLDPAAALAHARRLREDGADIIELGPAASHPGSAPVSAAEERRRLAPVLESLAADGIAVSVDSFQPGTLRFAVSAGAAWLNDIHGFGDPGLYPVLAASQCRLVVMHAVQKDGAATEVATDPAAVLEGMYRFFARRLAALRAAGIGRDRIVIDPGLGYFLGSTPGPSLAALAGIRELKETFGVPVLVSPSRKSFLRALTGRDVTRSGPATLAAEIFAAWQGADYIRTHDVTAARDALAFLSAVSGAADAAGAPRSWPATPRGRRGCTRAKRSNDVRCPDRGRECLRRVRRALLPADVGVCGDRKVLPLADAVRRMSGLPAATLGLSGRGVLREGAYADIIVFDPATVADRATFADPHQLSTGVSEVLVNGKVTISGGAFTGEFAGRALAGPGTAVSGGRKYRC